MTDIQTIHIHEYRIAVPNISAKRAQTLEKHLNKLIHDLCITTLQIVMNPEIDVPDVSNDDPIMSSTVQGWMPR